MALTYSMQILGPDGSPLGGPSPNNSFVLTNFTFDQTAVANATVGGSVDVSLPTVSALTVDFASMTADQAKLLADAFSQAFLPRVEIQGTNAQGVIVYDLQVQNVSVTKYHDSNLGFEETFSFSPLQAAAQQVPETVSIANVPVNPNGTQAGTGLVTKYDLLLAKESSFTRSDIGNFQIGPQKFTPPTNTNYFLTVDQVNGGCVDPSEKGAFVLNNFSFDVTNSVTGPPAFTLTASFSVANAGTGLAQLFQKMGNKILGSIELKGQDSKSAAVVYDLQIGQAAITDIHDNGSGIDTITFKAASAITLTTTDQATHVANTASWNFLTYSATGVHVTSPTPAQAANISITTADKVTSQAVQVISGAADADETGLKVSVFDGTVLVGTTTVQADTTWSLPITLSGNGVHAIEATLTDAAGNPAFSNLLHITLAAPTTVQQEVEGLYSALYGRASEFPAYSFWVGYAGAGLNTGNAGTTAVTLAQATTLGQGFVNSQNTFFNQTYGALTDSQFINAMYLNIGGATGDPNGISYWSGLLAQAEAQGQSIQAARAGLVGQFVQALVGFDSSTRPGGVTDQQWADALTRQATINNKITVSLAYANASNGPGGGILVPAAVGDAAYNAAVAVLQGVTSDPNTVSTALTGIANAVSHHDLTLI